MSNLAEAVENAAQSFLSWAVITIAAGGVWIIRRVFTNQKQIELLQAHLESRDELRERDRADIQEVKQDVKELNKNVMHLFKNHHGD